ncbi:MAG TPA: hypothetical protein VN666_12275 [Nitrospira sp.]|nr:hypothetical protein [Nitrospira sp.]
MKRPIQFLLFMGALWVHAAAEANVDVHMNLVDEKGVGKEIGKVSISETQHGLLFTPAVSDVPPGLHGFHYS